MTGTEISAINLKWMSKPVCKLIEVLSNTAGVLYEPTKIRRRAKAESDAEVIRTKTDIQLSELQRRSLTRLINEESIKQEHVENIIENAIPLIDSDAAPENIDPDWLFLFIEKAKNISSENMQLLWAKVLAGETNAAGSFSKRTIYFLSTIDREDADIFTELCCYTIVADTLYPIIFYLNEENNPSKSKGIAFESLSHLDDIGLIKFTGVGEFRGTEIEAGTRFMYFGKEVPNVLKEGENEFSVGSVLFSNIGKELFYISGAKFDETIYKDMIKRYA